MAAPHAYRKNFRASVALELFYTGGPVALSADASFAACACSDDIKLVNVETGKVRGVLKGDSELVTAITLTPDGKFLFSASRSSQIRHWDLASVSNLRSWKAHDAPVAAMAMDPSGGLLATGSADKTVLVWDVDGAFCTHAFRGHKGVVTSVLFHPNPECLLLFSGGEDAVVRVWDLVKKTCVSVLDEHFAVVTSLSSDGFNLVTAGRDKVVNIWDLRDYKLQTTVPVHEIIETVCVIPKACNLPGSNDSKMVPNGSSPTKMRHPGVRFLTVGELGAIRVWDSNSAVCLYNSSDVGSAANREAKRGFVQAAVIVPDGKVMCVTTDQCLLFYETVNREELKLYKRLIGYNDEVIDLKFVGKDATALAVATNQERIRVYDIDSMACIRELDGHADTVLSLDSCTLPLGRSLLVSSGKDRMIRVWDMEDGSCIGIAAGHMAPVGAVAFSKKHRSFFVSGSSDRTLKVWNIEDLCAGKGAPKTLSSQAAVVAHDKDINAVAIAPNDSLVCSASQDRTAQVWRLPELVHLVTLTGHKRGVWSVEFSPVDQCILTASGDKTIRLWALADGSCLKSFEGHTASVLKIAFICKGTQFISTGADGLVKLWTIKGNECTNTFDNHEDKIWALAVSPVDERIATGGADSQVNLWEDCTASDREEVFRRQNEEATKDQDLQNALKDTDYIRAVQLAFELKRPFRLLSVFEEVLRSEDSDNNIGEILKALEKEHLRLLLQYVCDWNSRSKFCVVAQRVLFNLLHVVPATSLVKVPSVGELLEGILPYTQRHLTRIDRLSRSTFMVDFILSSMSSIIPDGSGQHLGNAVLPPNLLQSAATNNRSTDASTEERSEIGTNVIEEHSKGTGGDNAFSAGPMPPARGQKVQQIGKKRRKTADIV